MALFGTDMIDVMTPDGRRITMPSQLAAGFPALQPAPAPTPEWSPQDTTALQQATPPLDATAAPVTLPSQVPTQPEPSVPRGPVTLPAQATDAGPPNTPGKPPVTNDQLAKLGNAGAYNAEAAAIDSQRGAAQRQGEALANQATAVGNATAESEAHAAQLLEQRKQVAEEHAQALQAKSDEYLRNAKAIADTKIDRSADHPVLAALAVALGGFGAALAGHGAQNLALDAVMKSIDRKVAGQVQDLEQKRAGLGLQKEALGMQRQAGIDRLAEMDTYRLGYIEQAKRQVAAIQQKTQSDVVRANTGVVMAGLDKATTETLGNAVNREATQRDAQAARKQTMQIAQMSNATAIRGQNIQQREADLNREERKQEKLDAIAAQIALAQGKQKDEVKKQLSEQAIVDPATGDLLLTPEGQQKLAKADSYEAQARKATDPAQAQKLSDLAGKYRESARTNDIALALNKEGAQQAQKITTGTQSLVNDIDSAKRMLQAGPDGPAVFNREDWAQIKVGLQNVKINYASTIGERLSVRALEALDDVLSIDTDSMFSRAVDKGKALKALDTLSTELVQKANVAIRGTGVKATWKPATTAGAETKDEFAGKTAQEISADAKPGLLGRSVAEIARTQAPQDSALEAANARRNAKGQTSDYGLAPEVDDKIREKIKRSGDVGNEEYGRIVKQLRQPLQSGRPSLAAGAARLLRDTDPKLFGDVVSGLTEAERGELQAQLAPWSAAEPLTDEERAQAKQREAYKAAYEQRARAGTRPK